MELTDQYFELEVYESNLPILVDFWASWCPPCKMMEPIVDRLESEYEGRVRILRMNVDRNPETASTFSIQGLPTFIMFRGREVLGRLTAAQTEKKLKKLIEQAFENEKP